MIFALKLRRKGVKIKTIWVIYREKNWTHSSFIPLIGSPREDKKNSKKKIHAISCQNWRTEDRETETVRQVHHGSHEAIRIKYRNDAKQTDMENKS